MAVLALMRDRFVSDDFGALDRFGLVTFSTSHVFMGTFEFERGIALVVEKRGGTERIGPVARSARAFRRGFEELSGVRILVTIDAGMLGDREGQFAPGMR